jgi:uncharacterized protein with PIN domain
MPNTVNVRFHGELNDFIAGESQHTDLEQTYDHVRSIKDLLESMGVPHTEINVLMVNGSSVDFSYLVAAGDSIDAYPAHDRPGSSAFIALQPAISGSPAFVLDVHLGKLAAYMRMYGFDAYYQNNLDDPALASISAEQNRILLTCDRRLLMRSKITSAYFVRQRIPEKQLEEVIQRYQLADQIRPFSRCIHCNGFIKAVDKSAIESQLLPKTREHYDRFFQCQQCGKIYWEGSHVTHMKTFMQRQHWSE